MLRIINTLGEIGACFPGGVFDKSAWEGYARSFSKELCEKCESDAREYDFAGDILPVLNGVACAADDLAVACRSFEAVTSALQSRISALFQDDIRLDIILYLGLCNGAGWATTLDGCDVVLLGIEKILELNWQGFDDMQGLILHEIGHIWHKTHGVLHPAARTMGECSLVQLWQEGIAMVCEHTLSQQPPFRRMDKSEWLAWCNDNLGDIAREFARRVAHDLSTQDFFGDWCAYLGRSDVGYFLGHAFVRYLQGRYTLLEIANMDVPALMRHFEAFALSAEADNA